MFFRRRLVSELNQFFDPQWRDVGDGEWMVRLLRQKIRMVAAGQFTSVFTQTGANMSAGPNARNENRRLARTAPAWVRASKPLIILHHRLRRLLGGMYFGKPFSFAIYTPASPAQRIVQIVSRPAIQHRA
jgi:hypothetical protein